MEEKTVFKNPLSVTTPEGLSAKEAKELFVDVLSDYPKVMLEGHSFIKGPRGCGKSMIFRYLKPDCQRLVHNYTLNQLPFYGLYIPLRNTEASITELLLLNGLHANTVLNEHFLVLYLATNIFDQVREDIFDLHDEGFTQEAKAYFNHFFDLFARCGWISRIPRVSGKAEPYKYFKAILDICNQALLSTIQYISRLIEPNSIPSYTGPLCGYMNFLFPLLKELRKLSFTPKGPIFLLIDDADNLNLTQTKILNTWVSTRTSAEVSLKISSQLDYKTIMTLRGNSIDYPHDYSLVDISTIYTASTRHRYRDRIRAIVQKRLILYEHSITDPEEFFPEDVEQEQAIKIIADKYRSEWPESGKGYRPSDDAIRYARPDFMKSLAGASKSSSTYNYGGFNQLVHLSSGVIRYFLEPAAIMYNDAYIRNQYKKVEYIPIDIQNRVVREQADEFLFGDLDTLMSDQSPDAPKKDSLLKLRNLIQALGGTFKEILFSDRSERRVFSIAFSNEPDEEVKEILNLGVRLNYFHLSAIGNKEGTGRTSLYVLNRRLAPYFYLDPTSFAGYLFVTNLSIREAMYNPQSLLRKVHRNIDAVFETQQLSFAEVAGERWT